MAMTLKETIRRLKRIEESRERKGYGGDAADMAFQRYCLELLNSIATNPIKPKRKLSAYQIRLGKFLKQGKSLQEAHRLAKK
jgi:hypothetical protein